jgi:hypothetical protein
VNEPLSSPPDGKVTSPSRKRAGESKDTTNENEKSANGKLLNQTSPFQSRTKRMKTTEEAEEQESNTTKKQQQKRNQDMEEDEIDEDEQMKVEAGKPKQAKERKPKAAPSSTSKRESNNARDAKTRKKGGK